MTNIPLSFQANGEKARVTVDGRSLLVEVLRDHLGLKSPRIGCLTGDCGACSVMVDGELTKSCLVLAPAIEGREVRTLEGLGDELVALKAAFIACNGFQCGYCTSGMLLAALDLLRRRQMPGEEEIRDAISGNLCRCTGYDDIVVAIRTAARDAEDGTRDERQRQDAGHAG